MRKILFVSILFIFIINNASATKLYVEPASILDQNLTPEKNFSVNIGIKDVTKLFGFELKLGYDSSILKATEVIIAPFLIEPVWLIKNESYDGKIWIAIVSLNTTQSKSEDGTLATIKFQVLEKGQSTLELYDRLFINPDGELISHEIESGYFSNSPECPKCPSPSEWSECKEGKQTRTNYRCSKATDYKCQAYTEEKSCEVTPPLIGGGIAAEFPAALPECKENWICTEWSACISNKQTRRCVDRNNCGTTINKPEEERSCEIEKQECAESWQCTDWSECKEGKQTRSCVDLSRCGTIKNKPEESRACEEKPLSITGMFSAINSVYISLILLAIIAIALILARIKIPKARQKEEKF